MFAHAVYPFKVSGLFNPASWETYQRLILGSESRHLYEREMAETLLGRPTSTIVLHHSRRIDSTLGIEHAKVKINKVMRSREMIQQCGGDADLYPGKQLALVSYQLAGISNVPDARRVDL